MTVVIIPNKNAATHTQYGTEANSTRQWAVLSEVGAVRSITGGCEGNWAIEVDVHEEEYCSYTVELEEKATIAAGTKITIGFQSRIRTRDEIKLYVYVNDDEGQQILGPLELKRKCQAFKGDVTLSSPMKKICFKFDPGNPDSYPIIDGLWFGFGEGSPSGGGGGANEDERPGGSIQEQIENALKHEAIPLSTIMIQNKSGDAYVPAGVNIKFYDCDMGTIEFGGDNAFQFEGGSIGTMYIAPGCQFLVRDVPTIDILEVWGSSGTFRNITFTTSINIREQSDIEFIDTVHISPKILDAGCSRVYMLRPQATVPETGIYAKNSNVILSGAHFEQKHGYVVKVEDQSYVQITDCHLEGYYDCPALSVLNKSVGIVTQNENSVEPDPGLFSGVNAVKASGGSYVRIKNSHITGSPGNWHDYGIIAEDNSVVEADGNGAVRCEGGDEPGIRATNNSSVTITNSLRVWGITKEAIYCDTNSKVRVFGLTTEIRSFAVDAIWIRDNSRVEIYDVPLIFADAGDAVDMSEYCDFIAVNISDKMEGVSSYGVLATIHCDVKMDRVVACLGDGDDGVFLEDNCRLIAMNGERILGKGDNGIEAKTNCQIVVKDYSDQIIGLATDGIHMEDDCKATLLRVAKVVGQGKDGVYMKNNCTCHSRYCDEIIGEARDGFSMEESCRMISINDGKIEGVGRDGIHGEESCEATSIRGEKILGTGRDGIFMENGKLINVQRTTEVRGTGRDGIHATKCEIDAHHIDILHGDGDKCIYVEQCIGTFETIPDGYGASYGLYEIDNSDIRIFRSNIAGASPLSLYMNNSSRLFAKDVEFQIKDAKTVEHCEVYLEIVTIYGKFESKENCKHEWLRVKIMDKIDFEDSIYRWKEVEILGDHICKKCTGKAENVEVEGNFEDEDSENHFSNYTLQGNIDHKTTTTKLKGSQILGLIGLTTCTLRGENTTVSQITDFTSSKVEYDACDVANIDGKDGSSYKQAATVSAQIQLNESAGKMEGGETGTIQLTDSSLHTRNATAGSVTMSSSSSLLQRGGTCGAITGSDSTYENHAGTAGAVIMTSGSVTQYGGTVGAVTVITGGYLNQGGTGGAVIMSSGGLALAGGTIGAVVISSSGFIQQGGTAGPVVLSNSAFTGKGGSCGSVSCGSSALELISMSSGAISGVHQPIPSCSPGQVVRVGTDKLYEVFDENVKRWFNKNLEERITVDKKVNVKGDSFHRIDGNYELDVGKTSSFVTKQTCDIHSTGNMELVTMGDLIEDASGKIDITSGGGDVTIESALNLNVYARLNLILSALVNLETHCNVLLSMYANGSAIFSAPTITELTPSWTWPGQAAAPAIPTSPTNPGTPEDPDPAVDPTP